MDIKDIIKEKTAIIEPKLLEFTQIGNERMQEMLVHPITAGGKRIRPILLLLSCESVGGSQDKALSAAASIELLHTFTLIHDDIMDHDKERRGKPTVHEIWGEELAIVVGDTMYSGAFKALVETRLNGVSEAVVLNAVEALVHANSELQEGQILDMLFEDRKIISEEEYMDMIGKKTGSLIEASMKIGCIIGGGSKQQMDALSLFGKNIGISFQIKDDLLDLTADHSELGKPVGSDVRKGKKTLIIVHALNNGTEDQKQHIKQILGKEDASDEEISALINTLNEIGSIDYVKNQVKQLIDAGKLSLSQIEDSKAKEGLISISDYLLKRRN